MTEEKVDLRGVLLRGKRWRKFAIPGVIVLVILVAILAVRPIFSAKGQTTAVEGIETADVTRGSIQRSVSAFGYLVMPQQVKLTFGGTGKIKEVKVKMGDSVKKGDILARLDTTALEVALLKAEDAFAKAKKAWDDINKPFSETEIAVAKASLAAAEARLTGTWQAWATDQTSASKWSAVKSAEAELERAREAWRLVEEGRAVEDIASAERQLKIAQASLDDAKRQIEEAIIVAPYDGIVAKVFVEQGARASADTTAVVQLVDPTKFELQATVDEIDISRVRAGQQVTISIDALSDVSFPGRVTAIGPVGVRTQGVVSFPITISVEPGATSANRVAARAAGSSRPSTSGSSGSSSGSPPVSGGGAAPSTTSQSPRQQSQGAATQQGGDRAQTPGTGPAAGARSAASPVLQAAANPFASMKEGMTATGTIIIEQRTDVLTVPSRAVKTQRGRSTVEVVVGNTTEQREVQIGITDGSRTEIVSGLELGLKVVIPRTTIRQTNVPTSPQPGMMFR